MEIMDLIFSVNFGDLKQLDLTPGNYSISILTS